MLQWLGVWEAMPVDAKSENKCSRKHGGTDSHVRRIYDGGTLAEYRPPTQTDLHDDQRDQSPCRVKQISAFAVMCHQVT
jgi:hypothetical protein